MPDTPRLCAYCAEPLPPHTGRGRPALTHPGDCRRKRRNATRLQERVDAFREYLNDVPEIDRSDGVVRGAVPVDRVSFDDLHDEHGTPAYTIMTAPKILIHPKEFLSYMHAFEETQASLSALRDFVGEVDPEIRAKVALIPEIRYDEYMALLARHPGSRMSPAFAYYAEHREELDAAQVEYFRQLSAAHDAREEAKRAARETRKAAAASA